MASPHRKVEKEKGKRVRFVVLGTQLMAPLKVRVYTFKRIFMGQSRYTAKNDTSPIPSDGRKPLHLGLHSYINIYTTKHHYHINMYPQKKLNITHRHMKIKNKSQSPLEYLKNTHITHQNFVADKLPIASSLCIYLH